VIAITLKSLKCLSAHITGSSACSCAVNGSRPIQQQASVLVTGKHVHMSMWRVGHVPIAVKVYG